MSQADNLRHGHGRTKRHPSNSGMSVSTATVMCHEVFTTETQETYPVYRSGSHPPVAQLNLVAAYRSHWQIHFLTPHGYGGQYMTQTRISMISLRRTGISEEYPHTLL